MATKYTAIVQEFPKDVAFLVDNKYNLALAKGIANVEGGDPEFNVIFASNTVGTIAPTMKISWQETYGMNWSLEVAQPGAEVTFGGFWTECAIGDGLILQENGLFTKGTGQPSGLYLENKYLSVCILIGVQDQKTKKWHAIFRSTSKVLPGGSGLYVPTEWIQIWFGNNQNSNTVIASQQTAVELYDMSESASEKNTHWFSLDTKSGKWSDQNHAYFDPGNSVEIVGQPWRKFIKFSIEVTDKFKWLPKFKASMDKHWVVEAVFKISEKEYEVTIKEKPKGDDGDEDPVEDMDAALKACLKDGDLPEGETWTIADKI